MTSSRRWALWILTGALLSPAACNSNPSEPTGKQEAPTPDGNFDVGTQPLRLKPAPGGLCSGEGADKECSTPGNCAEDTEGASTNLRPGGNPAQPGTPIAAEPGFGPTPIPNATTNPTPTPSINNPSFPGSIDDIASPADDDGFYDDDDVSDDDVPLFTPEPTPLPNSTPWSDAGAPITPIMSEGPDAGAAPESPSVPGDPDAGVSQAQPLAGPDAGLSGVDFSFTQINLPSDQCSALDDTTTATLYLSTDDSNSMASPVIARRLIRAGERVPPGLIRSYEFLNYYDFEFVAAKQREVRIIPQLSSCPKNGELNLQVALQAERRSVDDRKPLNLTFVLDISGSMNGQPMTLQKAAVHALAKHLKRGDVVSVVTWDTVQKVDLQGHNVTGPNDATLLTLVDSLQANGGTDLDSGLRAGYELARRHHSNDRINRVIVISDGIANVGETSATLIGQYADDEEGSEEGIYLAGIGVGAGVNDTLMNAITDAGRGAYVYLDSEAEAEKMLGDRFIEIVDVAAREVRLELTLPWYMQVIKFYGEAISTDPSKVRPQHLAPNSAMVYFQVLNACNPELIHGDDRIRISATWTTPFQREAKRATIDTTLNELAGEDRHIAKAAVVAGYAEALQQAGLQASASASVEILDRARSHVLELLATRNDPDLVELDHLLYAYAAQFGGSQLDSGIPQ